MSNVSQERQAIAGLIMGADLERGPRFDPTAIETISRPNGDVLDRVHLKKTLAFPSLGRTGNMALAVYSDFGPAISRETSSDIIHHEADAGVLLVQATDENLERLGVPETSEGITIPPTAWVVQLLTVRPGLQSPDFLDASHQITWFVKTV